MRNVVRILLIGLILGLFMFVGTVAAEVDWTDDVADDPDDVADSQGPVSGKPGLDILSVSITEDGDNLNITIGLAGAYEDSGSYSVFVRPDGGDPYHFKWLSFLGFDVYAPDQSKIPSEGYFSADGKLISWVVAKADITVSSSLRISMASATVGAVADYAGMLAPGDAPIPDEMEVVMRFAKLNILEMKITITYTDGNAGDFRRLIDGNADGTVSDTELQDFIDEMEADEEPDPSEANVTFDGKDPTDLTFEYSIDGAKGDVDGSSDVSITVTMRLTFPKAEDKDTHEIVFIDNPFGDDFIGGDEPWENPFDMTFRFKALDGWKFKEGSFPTKMKDYLNKDGDEVTMNTAAIKADWNTTMAQLNGFTIEKTDGDDDGPGFGLVFVMAAATVAALAMRRRRLG